MVKGFCAPLSMLHLGLSLVQLLRTIFFSVEGSVGQGKVDRDFVLCNRKVRTPAMASPFYHGPRACMGWNTLKTCPNSFQTFPSV